MAVNWGKKFVCSASQSRSSRIIITAACFVVVINVFLQLPIKNRQSAKESIRETNKRLCNLDYINSKRLQQDHPCVIEIIRRDFLRMPSPLEVPYNLSKPDVVDPSPGQSKIVLTHLNNKTDGFFVECGAQDGERLSNTLYMERHLNWSGILVEPMKRHYNKLVSRNRKSYTSPVCLSLDPYPTLVHFNATLQSSGKIIDSRNQSIDASNPRLYKVQCFPLYSILLAAGQTSIDFFSLDVEGHELKILKTIPWDKVNIKTLAVDWAKIFPEADFGLTSFMEAHGYVMAESVGSWTKVLIFVKKSIFQNLIQASSSLFNFL